MRLLPSEQRRAVEDAVQMLERAKVEGKTLVLREPCNCGDVIRHFTGGNYHARWEIAYDEGRWFIKYDTTCLLTPEPEWEEISDDEVREVVAKAAADGWSVYLD